MLKVRFRGASAESCRSEFGQIAPKAIVRIGPKLPSNRWFRSTSDHSRVPLRCLGCGSQHARSEALAREETSCSKREDYGTSALCGQGAA